MESIFRQFFRLPGLVQVFLVILLGLIPVVTAIQLLIIQNIGVMSAIPWAVIPAGFLLFGYYRLVTNNHALPRFESFRSWSGVDMPVTGKPALIVLVVILLILFTATSVSAGFAFAQSESPQILFLQNFRQLNPEVAIPLLFMLALTAGIVEEIVFRGFVQKILIHSYGVIKGIGIVAVLFTLVHFLPMELYLPYFLVSVLFSLVAYHFNSTMPCILAHFAFDFIAFCLFYFEAPITSQEYFEQNWIMNAFMAILFVIILTYIYYFRSKNATIS